MVVKNKQEKVETFIFELTNRCNENCDFCYSISYNSITGKPRFGQIDKDKCFNVLDTICEYGAKSIDFSGGEPTLHPNFSEIIRYSKEKGLDTILSTNGSTINNENIRNSIIDSVNCVALSIHGVNDVHDKIKYEKGSYMRAINSLEMYLSNNLNVKVNSVLCNENVSNIKEIGESIGIRDKENLTWKISQAVTREAGLLNRNKIDVGDEVYEMVKKDIIERYSQEYNAGKIIFRENDVGKEKFSPYLIINSNGSLYIPKGELHKRIGNILDNEWKKDVENYIFAEKEFIEKLNKNHRESYQK